MSKPLTCPSCKEPISEDDSSDGEEVRCPNCGYLLSEEDLEKSDDIEDLIELDLASDGDLDGDLFDF